MTDLGYKHQAGRIVINCFPLVFGLMLIESCTKVCQLRKDNGGITEQILLQGYCKGIATVLHEPVMNP